MSLPPRTRVHASHDIQRGHHRLVKQGAHGRVVDTHPHWTGGSYTVEFEPTDKKHPKPVVTVVGFEIGILMGGSAIVEIIFGLPGIGNTLINAIFNRDYPVVQGATMLLAFIFIFANLAVDLLYGVLDPRISQE